MNSIVREPGKNMKPITNMKTKPMQPQLKLKATLAAMLAGLCFAISAEAQTITWQENWESPSAADNWFADNGYWEIGVPTYGPPDRGDGWRAHQGTNVAGTVLNGNYTDDRQSRLISSPISIPAAGQNPRLRFWHWWSFHFQDFGQVQISTNNGASWQALSPRYGYDGPVNFYSDGWTRARLDLTPYAGKTVLLGLYFYAVNALGGDDTAPGWYVDELSLETGSVAEFIPLDSFEDAAAADRWAADYGAWEIGAPASGPGSAHSGSNCLATILSGNYSDDRSSRVRSQEFVVPPAETNPRLRFWHWWSFSSGDLGKVQISADDGTSWTDLATYTTSSPWTRPQLDLAAYAGQTVRLGFYFYAVNAVGGDDTAPGWYIDEVRLLHEPALFLVGSPVVRTQDTACVSLAIAVDSPSSGASFVIEAPAGNLNNAILSTKGCWSGTITPQSAAEWLVNLQSSCTAGSAGVETIGTICFSAVSPHSAFVPLTVNSLVISNLAPAQAFGTRAVNIASEPLLEAWLDSSQKRMLTIYGQANTAYAIHQSTNLSAIRPWLPGWTNTIPASLVTKSPVSGPLSNAPVLFLDALEQ
jgi:hypothetical protein